MPVGHDLVIRGTGVTEANLNLTDVTTANVSITQHGFAPKAPNDATKFLDGTGAYSTPSGGTGTVTTTGSPASGNLVKFSGATSITNGDLSGDVTTSGALASTIATGAVTDDKSSLSVKPSVSVVATANLTLSGGQTIDGVAGTVNQTIVLATGQSTGSQNGPWIMQTGAWTRPSWYPSGGTTQGIQFSTTFVRLGTLFQGSMWRLTTAAPITIDTTATAWSQTPTVVSATSVTNGITGSGAVVLANTPTLITPVIGAATGTSLAVSAGLTSGANGGTAGQVTFNGSTSGSQSLTTNAGASTLTLSSGTLAIPSLQLGQTNTLSWLNRARIQSPADSVIEITNNAQSDFNRLQFGGTTSSFPSIKKSSTTLIARLADDSADSNYQAANFVSTAAAGTAAAGQVAIGATTASTVGAAGGASALPITPSGYLIINVAGTQFKLPYYAN